MWTDRYEPVTKTLQRQAGGTKKTWPRIYQPSSRTRPKVRIAGDARGRHDRPVWETTDPDGRRIVLSAERWLHVLEDHEELGDELAALLSGLAAPAIRRRGRWPDEKWFYLAGPGPTRFVKVVVHYEHGVGRIVTAFPRRAFP